MPPPVFVSDCGRAAAELTDSTPLLEVQDLSVEFLTREGAVHALNGVSFSVRRGEVLACSASVTLRATLGLDPGRRARVLGARAGRGVASRALAFESVTS